MEAKYYGQRLKAKDVLRLYAAGERDFRGAILRGCNFCGADLSGADFSEADIRSAWFVNAMLQEVKFCGACGGLQKRWIAGQLSILVSIATLIGLLQGFSGGILGFYLLEPGPESELRIAGFVGLIVVATTLIAIKKYGFTSKTLGSFTAIFILAFAVAVIVAAVYNYLYVDSFSQALTIASGIAVGIAFATAISGTIAVASIFIISISAVIPIAIAFAVTVAVAIAYAFGFVGGHELQYLSSFAITIAIAVVSLILYVYIDICVSQSDPKFKNLRIIGLAFSALGGTSFSGADLTEVYFTNAVLRSVNFANSRKQATILTHIRWHRAQKLARARLGDSNLQDLRVREILITLDGNNKDLSKATILKELTWPMLSLEALTLRALTLTVLIYKLLNFTKQISRKRNVLVLTLQPPSSPEPALKLGALTTTLSSLM